MSSLLLFTLTSLACFAQDGNSYDWLIAKNRLGRIQLDMSVDEAKEVLGLDIVRVVDLEYEGFFTPAIIISDTGGRLVTAELICSGIHQWTIWRVEIHDPRYRTAQNIHVGSTLKELQKQQPALKITNNGGRIVIDKDQGISYFISDGPLESAAVDEILVLGNPSTKSAK